MNIWIWLWGMLEAEMVSAQPEWLLRKINEQGIELFSLQQTDPLTYRFWLRKKDWSRLSALCRKQEAKLQLLQSRGPHRFLKSLGKRPVLLAGTFLLFFLFLLLPTRILFVQVEGNHLLPDRQILAAAEKSGIRFGASRREVRSEKVKNALLSELPMLQWAGVNTSGCVATVSVRERAVPETPEIKYAVSSIVAARDGYVLSATAARGNLLVQPGQLVAKGQILISGYTDCGIVIRAEEAAGEIYAQTSRELTVVSPAECSIQRPHGKALKKISLIIEKKRIILWKDSGISGDSCGRMYKEYYITLPGGFMLPAAVCVEEYIRYQQSSDTSVLSEGMEPFARSYCLTQMAAGEILQEDLQYTLIDGTHRLRGTFVCREMIGRVLGEQIGERNE